MKLFFYYAFHCVKNGLKKLFKTWVLVFILVCALLGGAIGYGAAKIEDMAEENSEAVEDVEEAEEEESPSLPEKLGVESGDLLELICGFIALGLFAFQILSADKNGGKLFQNADVNLLFASPMKPQAVLTFRLMTQMGTAVFLVFYLLLQVPNLTLNMGMSLPAALGLIVFISVVTLAAKLLQVLFYLLCSLHPKLKNSLRRCVYAVLGALLLAFVFYHRSAGGNPVTDAVHFFNAPFTRFIPLWGWLKAFVRCMADGKYLLAALAMAASILAAVVVMMISGRLPADFYEDAMAKSEEVAEKLSRAQAEQTSVAMKKRKKDRSDKLRRDGLRHGQGASVIFFKNVYNRFRFAHFGFMTKTTETYLVAVAAVVILCKNVLDADPAIPIALTLAGLSYFRAMGNPLDTDVNMSFFLMMPENIYKKLFYSLLGGLTDCLLDLLPALLLGLILTGGVSAETFLWIPLILSIDFYATTVGAFIDVSVPVKAGKTVKTFVQVIFVYFGLLPDVAIMAVGIVLGHTAAAAVGSAVLNTFLGMLFFGLIPLYLDPRCTSAREKQTFAGDLGAAKKLFSRIGWSTAVMLMLGTVLQLLAMMLADRFFPNWADHPAGIWLLTFVPLYCAAIPLGLLLLPREKAERAPSHSFRFGQWVSIVFISLFFMYGGNLIGTIITSVLAGFKGAQVINPLESYAVGGSVVWKILVMVVAAPVIEETIFRRLFIDRMRLYGERTAVFASALLFGLFHGNLSQFFYAFALGLLFGYVYLRTQKLRCTILLHMMINFLGSVWAPWLLENADLSALTGELGEFTLTTPTLLYFGYAAFLMLGALAGLVLLCIQRRNVRFEETELTLPREKRFGVVWGNSGMIAIVLASLALTVYATLV